MRRIKFSLSIGYANAGHEEVVEFDDDATDEQIEQDYQDWCSSYIDGGWWPADEESE